jgi:hypothetical protein
MTANNDDWRWIGMARHDCHRLSEVGHRKQCVEGAARRTLVMRPSKLTRNFSVAFGAKRTSMGEQDQPRRITRWEHEHLLEVVQQRLDANPEAMRQRRETVEHPFGTMKARMGATHFLTKTLPKVAAEMALSVLAYNLTRVMNIVGVKPLIAAIAA